MVATSDLGSDAEKCVRVQVPLRVLASFVRVKYISGHIPGEVQGRRKARNGAAETTGQGPFDVRKSAGRPGQTSEIDPKCPQSDN